MREDQYCLIYLDWRRYRSDFAITESKSLQQCLLESRELKNETLSVVELKTLLKNLIKVSDKGSKSLNTQLGFAGIDVFRKMLEQSVSITI